MGLFASGLGFSLFTIVLYSAMYFASTSASSFILLSILIVEFEGLLLSVIESRMCWLPLASQDEYFDSLHM